MKVVKINLKLSNAAALALQPGQGAKQEGKPNFKNVLHIALDVLVEKCK
jgi:hypothetical protein